MLDETLIREDVAGYLAENPDVKKVLPEAIAAIKSIFGNVDFCLQIMDDPDSGSGDVHLLVEILMKLEVDDALNKLEEFDQQWLFKQNNYPSNKIVFTLGFLL